MSEFFHNFFARFTATVRAIIGFILPIAESHASELIAVALPIAQGFVTQLANQQIPSADKRDQAVASLKSALVAQGYSTAADLATSTLNWVVETALQKLNASAAAPAPTSK